MGKFSLHYFSVTHVDGLVHCLSKDRVMTRLHYYHHLQHHVKWLFSHQVQSRGNVHWHSGGLRKYEEVWGKLCMRRWQRIDAAWQLTVGGYIKPSVQRGPLPLLCQMTTMVYFLFSLVLHDLDMCHLSLSLLTRVFLAVSDADVNPFVPHPAPGHLVLQFFSTLAKAASLTPMRPCTPVKKTILVSCQTPKDPSTLTKTQCFKLTSMGLDWCEAQLHFDTHPLLIPSAAGQRQAVCSIPHSCKEWEWCCNRASPMSYGHLLWGQQGLLVRLVGWRCLGESPDLFLNVSPLLCSHFIPPLTVFLIAFARPRPCIPVAAHHSLVRWMPIPHWLAMNAPLVPPPPSPPAPAKIFPILPLR